MSEHRTNLSSWYLLCFPLSGACSGGDSSGPNPHETLGSPITPLRLRRSAIAAFLLLVYLPACTSWHIGTPTPAAFLQREQPSRIRVTRTDGTRLMLTGPTVRGDSLMGAADNRDTTWLTLPLSKVQFVEVEKFSVGNTLLVAGGAIGVLVWAVTCSPRSGLNAMPCP